MSGSLVLYHLVMAGADALALWRLARRPTLATLAVVASAAALVGMGSAMALAGALGPLLDGFLLMRLLADGIFLYGTIGLAGAAMLLRKERRSAAIVLAVLGTLLAVVGVDAFWIEPYWLEVTHRRLASPKIDRPVRIAIVADLQCDRFGPYERRALARVMEEKPDMILLAGDYVQADEETSRRIYRECNEYLRSIRFSAPLGAFAVSGNVDRGDWPEMFAGLPVTVVPSRQTFNLGPLRLTCLNWHESCRGKLKVADPSPGGYHIVMGHTPVFWLSQVEADLLVAGHTHGGQVCLPGVGPLLRIYRRLPRECLSGLSDRPQGGQMLVSRGIGMERRSAPRLRFLCRPELAIVDLVPR